MRNSLLFRIAGPYILLIILLVTSIGIYLTIFINNTTLTSLERQLLIEANMIADQVSNYYTDENFDLERNIVRNAALTDARITIIDINGSVIIDSEADSGKMDNHLDRPEVQKALNFEFGSDLRFSESLKEEFFYVAVPIHNMQGEIKAISRISVPISSYSKGLLNIHLAIIAASLLTIFLAIILAFLITNRTISPLKNLSKAINKLESDGEKNQIINFQKDEIEKISEYIWQLAEKMKIQNEEIKLEQKTLNAVLNQMNDAVLIIDGLGFVQLANPAAERMFSLPKGKYKEKTIVEVLRNHQLFELWKDCIKDHQQREIAIEVNHNKLFIQAIAKPLDEILANGVLLVIQDLTRVRQLEKIRSDFVSNVSHELRTPIASIKALADTLEEGALDDPTVAKKFLTRMNVEIDNLTQLVQELLELSKIESGRVPMKKLIISPQNLVNMAIERMQVQAERSGLNLVADFSHETTAILVDPDQIGQVFVNLIHNAIKFTNPGGLISVKTTENQEDVIFEIKDTGIGIEKEIQMRIFERFYKADKARSSGGTGLGLSIVKHIIEAHKGKVWVESTPGEGSSFYFSLPKN